MSDEVSYYQNCPDAKLCPCPAVYFCWSTDLRNEADFFLTCTNHNQKNFHNIIFVKHKVNHNNYN